MRAAISESKARWRTAAPCPGGPMQLCSAPYLGISPAPTRHGFIVQKSFILAAPVRHRQSTIRAPSGCNQLLIPFCNAAGRAVENCDDPLSHRQTALPRCRPFPGTVNQAISARGSATPASPSLFRTRILTAWSRRYFAPESAAFYIIVDSVQLLQVCTARARTRIRRVVGAGGGGPIRRRAVEFLGSRIILTR